MSTFGPLAAHAAPYLKLELPAKFYNVPADAPAFFSTRNGTRAKRELHSPPPAPVVRSDFDQEVKRMAELLRKELPHVAGLIRNPGSWKDLYYFFDAADLWVEGAVFLYFVISHISKENEIAQETHRRMEQNAIIFQYAGNWVSTNADRIANLPAEADLTTLFDHSQKADICRFSAYEMEAMKEALRFHHARLREKHNAINLRQCVDPLQQPPSHSSPAIQQGHVLAMHHTQTLVSQPLPAPHRENQHCSNLGPMHPVMNPQLQTYSQFMETQRMITNVVSSSPSASSSFHKKSKGQQHGPGNCIYSSEENCTGPYRNGGNPPHCSQGKLYSNGQHTIDTTSRDSPPGPTSQAIQPIYVHNSQCISPPHIREAVTNLHPSSAPLAGRKGTSNGVRPWNDGCQIAGHQAQNTHESFEKPGFGPRSISGHHRSRSIPFEGHPDAKVNEKTSTFYYKKETMGQRSDPHKNDRTLFVHGASVDMFLSHTLRDMVSEVGTVESISYLHTNPYLGPAFITFTEPSAVHLAISRFHGCATPTGRWLELKPSDKGKVSRDRSGSQSSQTYYVNYPSRFGHRNIRKNSTSSRQYSRSHQMGDTIKSQDNSPDAYKNRSGTRSPLTTGFQAQLNGSPPYTMPIPVEQLHSSISEILQHQSALERLRVTQTPLEPIDNYSGGNRKSTGPLHDRPRSNMKENSPIRENSNSATPAVTPIKEQVDVLLKESKHCRHGVNDNGSTKDISIFNAPEVTSIKSDSTIDLVEVLRASVRQKSLLVPRDVNKSNVESNHNQKGSVPDNTRQSDNHVRTAESTPESERELAILSSKIRVAIGISSPTVESGEDSPPVEEKYNPKKNKKNKKRPGNFRSEATVISGSTVATSTTAADTSSPTLTDTTDYKSAATSLSEASSRSYSFTSAKSVVSLSTTNGSANEQPFLQSTPTSATKHSKTGSSSSSSSLSTPKPPIPRNQHQSKNLKNQAISMEIHNNTYGIGEEKFVMADDKRSSSAASKSSSNDISCSDDINVTRVQVAPLRDSEEWPALERAKPTTSRIVDGKRPAAAPLPPATRQSTSASARSSNAVIPAVPLNMIPRRRNSSGVVESDTWPRVRKCVGK